MCVREKETDRQKENHHLCVHTHMHMLTYTLLLRLPNEILMGDVGSAGAGLAGGWWRWWCWKCNCCFL